MKQKQSNTKFANLVRQTEKLIAGGFLIVNSNTRNLILVESFWTKMDAKGQDNFIKNMSVYCKLKNAFEGIMEDDFPQLLLMIKDANQKINYFYRFKDNQIEKVNI